MLLQFMDFVYVRVVVGLNVAFDLEKKVSSALCKWHQGVFIFIQAFQPLQTNALYNLSILLPYNYKSAINTHYKCSPLNHCVPDAL